MPVGRKPLLACAALAVLGAFGLVLAQSSERPQPRAELLTPPAPKQAEPPALPPELPSSLRSLIIGGGALPDSSEVSLEQNVALALTVMPGPSAALFAGGPGTQSVRVDDGSMPTTLAARLGDLFAPRASRKSRFRASELPALRADLASVESALSRAFAEPTGAPLTVYVAAHGERGQHPADNAVLVWGNDALTARRLAQLHDGSARPLQLVITSCYSGGFAELAFHGAEEGLGPASAPRCGLYAGTWDRETSGCDPDPDRTAQESYSLHFLHALARRDPKGHELSEAEIDFDDDGQVSLLEAHARARLAARSIDVPTTTSERYLRSVQGRSGAEPKGEALLPEDAAVVRELSRALGLPDAASTQAELRAVEGARSEHDERIAAAEEAVDATLWPLLTRLLERYPVLDDPYHPDFPATLAEHADGIEALLTRSPEALAHTAATRELARLDGRALELELREARVLRLARAHENLGLAAALKMRGGPELARYEALLACERMPLAADQHAQDLRDGAPGLR